ncbi:MAG TPA: hypothetical protein DET40_23145 [Lentisphaeria bacterium]|nr:hypothetical protein [Lentisphaeria bacterium]
MAHNNKIWIYGEERNSGAALKRAVTVFQTTTESIRISCPMGCGSFWLKKEYSSLGVSLWIRLRSEILLELSKIFRNVPNVNFKRLPQNHSPESFNFKT